MLVILSFIPCVLLECESLLANKSRTGNNEHGVTLLFSFLRHPVDDTS